MAMLPEYYPGLPEDPYMEYLRKLGQFQRSSSDLPYTSLTNLRIENQYPGGRLPALPDDPVEVMNRNRALPQFNRLGPQFPAAYSESPVPGTAEMMRARDTLNQDADRRADAMIAEAQQRRSRPRSVQPITPPSMGPPPSTGNVRLPVRTQTSETQSQSAPAQGGGLLDIEDAPESGSSWYDDPMRMGLLQAGLGLMSAPRYSTNPNDVTLSSALAKGLGGFVQGYGGTKKRLSEAEQDRLDQEFKRSQMELDRMYKMALTDESAARAAREEANLTKQYEAEKQAEQRKREQILTIMELQQGNATTLAQLNNLSAEKVNEIYEGVVAPSQETRQRQELINQIQRGDDLTPNQKKILLEYAQNEESKYTDVLAMRDDYAAKNRGPEQVSTAAFENWLGTQTELTDIERNLVLSEVQRSGDTDSGFASVQKIISLKQAQKGDQPKDSSTMSGTIILQDPQSLANYRPEDYPGYQATKSRDRVLLKPMTADQLKAMNDKGAAAQAIDAYLQELRKIPGNSLELKYKALVEDPSLSALRSKFIHAIMKLKDAYDLGVLSGNDYDLLESALNDPTKILTIRNKENFIENVRQTGEQAYRSYAGDATLFNYDPLAYYSQYIANSYQLPSTLANPVNQEQARKNKALQGTTEDPDAYLLEPRP
jgi:hypothetical protein